MGYWGWVRWIQPMPTDYDKSEMRTVDNPIRGCGTKERGKAYLIGAGFSEFGTLPTWVSCQPAIPFREVGTDGKMTTAYKHISGLSVQLALEEITDFVAYGQGGQDHYEEQGFKNHVRHGVYESVDEVPELASQRHIDRIRFNGTRGGQHWGEIPHQEQTDILMRVGKSYYPEPEDFEQEAIRVGVSKAIPVSPGRTPPEIVNGVTRVWMVHPKATQYETEDEQGNTVVEYDYGVIGYAYLKEAVYTYPEDGNVPEYIQNQEREGEIEVVDIDDPESVEEKGHFRAFERDEKPESQSALDDHVPPAEWYDIESAPGGAGGGTQEKYTCKECGASITESKGEPEDVDHEDDCPWFGDGSTAPEIEG